MRSKNMSISSTTATEWIFINLDVCIRLATHLERNHIAQILGNIYFRQTNSFLATPDLRLVAAF